MKTVLLITIALLMSYFAHAQYESNRPEWMENIYVGGGLNGLSISRNQIFVSVNGLVGYKITEQLSAGIGLTYQYVKFRTSGTTLNDFGYNFYTQYRVYNPFFLMARYEIQSLAALPSSVDRSRKNYSAFLVGGGISQSIGDQANINFFALYNLSYRTGDSGRYNSPWVVGVNIGLGL